MTQNIQAIYEERKNLFNDIVRGNKINRIPVLSSISGFGISDSGTPYTKALRNWDVMKEVIFSQQQKYQFDSLFMPGTRNPIAIADALGGGRYIIDEESYSLSIIDSYMLEPDEYDELMKDKMKFIWEKAIPRRYPNATKEGVLNSFGAFLEYGQFAQTIEAELNEEFGCAPVSNMTMAHPLENLLSGWRGIKGLTLDLRRQPEKVIQYCDYALSIDAAVGMVKAGMSSPPPLDHIFDLFLGFLAQTVMSTKMFEKIYWPFVNKTVSEIIANDGTAVMFMEGDNTRLWDFFADFPKGHVALWLEQDNLFEAKKKFNGSVTLIGGYPIQLLSQGTKEHCIDFAKKCIEELGIDGNYILAFDKGLAFRRDAKPENLMAVMEYVHKIRI